MEPQGRGSRLWKWATAISTVGGIISTGILVVGSAGFVATILDAIIGIDLPWEDFPGALAFAASIVLALVALDLRAIQRNVRMLLAGVEVLVMQNAEANREQAERRLRARHRMAFRNESRWAWEHQFGWVPEVELRDAKRRKLVPIARENTAERTIITFDGPRTGTMDLSPPD